MNSLRTIDCHVHPNELITHINLGDSGSTSLCCQCVVERKLDKNTAKPLIEIINVIDGFSKQIRERTLTRVKEVVPGKV
jgi:hypothetical protein